MSNHEDAAEFIDEIPPRPLLELLQNEPNGVKIISIFCYSPHFESHIVYRLKNNQRC